VSWSELLWILLGAILLVCFGLLLGATWTTQAIQPRLRQLAEERRRLNEEWVAVRATHHRLRECPRCGYPLTGQDWSSRQLG
jgi:cell division protein FtsL